MDISRTDSLFYIADTNTTLWVNYTSTKLKKNSLYMTLFIDAEKQHGYANWENIINIL